MQNNFLVLDTETGGLNPHAHALLSLYAGVTDMDGNIIDERHYKILPRPGFTVQYAALQVNKIDLAQHHAIAQDAIDVADDLNMFLGMHKTKLRKRLTPLGWNIAFDLGFIHTHLLDKETWESFVSHRTMDVQVIARFFYGDGGLGETAKRLGMDFENKHDAEADAKATLAVYRELERKFKPNAEST